MQNNCIQNSNLEKGRMETQQPLVHNMEEIPADIAKDLWLWQWGKVFIRPRSCCLGRTPLFFVLGSPDRPLGASFFSIILHSHIPSGYWEVCPSWELYNFPSLLLAGPSLNASRLFYSHFSVLFFFLKLGSQFPCQYNSLKETFVGFLPICYQLYYSLLFIILGPSSCLWLCFNYPCLKLLFCSCL